MKCDVNRLKELIDEANALARQPGCAHVSTPSAAALQQVRVLERIADALESLAITLEAEHRR